MTPQSRVNWEFYALVGGRCAPWFGDRPKPEKGNLETNIIWVFPPEHVHGWVGERKRCRVAVLHYGSVPSVLAEIVRRHGFLRHKLSPAQVRRVEAIARELQPHFEDPVQASPLYVQKAQLELSLMVLEGAAMGRLPTLAGLAHGKIEHAVHYFQEHLAEGPSIANAARAAGVSTSHLRRLFMEARGESPRLALRRVAMERAIDLLSETDYTLDIVAELCGFAGASEFSRAFKKHYKVPPAVWRAGILPPYQRPVRIHGRLQFRQENDRALKKLQRYGAHK
jgi:AraC family transcriptional regulator